VGSVGHQNRNPVKTQRRDPESPIQVLQSAQLFIRTHNETPSVVAMSVSNEDRPTVAIQG